MLSMIVFGIREIIVEATNIRNNTLKSSWIIILRRKEVQVEEDARYKLQMFKENDNVM